eukprot:GEMP01077405.1.p1 GENE.GEMP01077405.1~~GEMP01077405.1.p1  ORF type:complete len:177 (+),score=61.14 GEMP01077405.1:52-531(+)
MDPLALLSDGEGSSATSDGGDDDEVDFACLEQLGYGVESLRESDLYQKHAAPVVEENEDAAAVAEEKVPDFNSVMGMLEQAEASAARLATTIDASTLPHANKGKEVNIRQRNKMQQKRGQATFTLKDERDCNNVFGEGKGDGTQLDHRQLLKQHKRQKI